MSTSSEMSVICPQLSMPMLEGGDEEGEDRPPEVAPETRIELEIPKLKPDLGNNLHFVKLPNFLSVETR